MTTIRKLAWIYCTIFILVVVIGYIPGFTDQNGLLLGGFKIDPVDDMLHLFSGIWAGLAAWKSKEAARFYFRVFGTFYTSDAFLGFFTGYAFTDFLTLNLNANAGYSFGNLTQNLMVNLPHFVLGPVAMLTGFVLYKRFMKS